VTVDAGPVDAGEADAGPVDAGPLDAGELDAGEPDAGPVDAGPVDKAASCTGTFGSALTNSFGRADGTVLAIVTPTDQQCPMPNSDHVIVEITIQGAVYRMVVNVESTSGDPDVRFAELDHALVGDPWSDGWHTSVKLDYPGDLGVHAGDGGAFTPTPMADLVARIDDVIPLNAPISVFATSSGGSTAASAHLIHRNGNGNDGAIVIDPQGANPHWLLFHFDEQSF
jgi:hypothetical protein